MCNEEKKYFYLCHIVRKTHFQGKLVFLTLNTLESSTRIGKKIGSVLFSIHLTSIGKFSSFVDLVV